MDNSTPNYRLQQQMAMFFQNSLATPVSIQQLPGFHPPVFMFNPTAPTLALNSYVPNQTVHLIPNNLSVETPPRSKRKPNPPRWKREDTEKMFNEFKMEEMMAGEKKVNVSQFLKTFMLKNNISHSIPTARGRLKERAMLFAFEPVIDDTESELKKNIMRDLGFEKVRESRIENNIQAPAKEGCSGTALASHQPAFIPIYQGTHEPRNSNEIHWISVSHMFSMFSNSSYYSSNIVPVSRISSPQAYSIPQTPIPSHPSSTGTEWSYPAATPVTALQLPSRIEIPSQERMNYQMVERIKCETINKPTLELPGVPAYTFLFVFVSELMKLNNSNKYFRGFTSKVSLKVKQNSDQLKNKGMSIHEIEFLLNIILHSEFLKESDEEDLDCIALESDEDSKIPLKTFLESLKRMTTFFGPASSKLQNVRNTIDKKISDLKGTEKLLLAQMENNLGFIFNRLM